jgi:hypothetical protein
MSFENQLSSSTNRGDFLSLDGRNPVAGKPKRLGAYETDGVRFERLGFRMEDGMRYVATTTTLLDNKRSTDVLNVSSAAWTTKDGGLNRREQLYLAREYGMESCFFSVAQNLFRWGDLEGDVRNHLEMARYVVDRHDYQPHHTVYSGISHGAMNGFGFSALGANYGFKVIYGDFRAPCFPGHIARTDLRSNLQKVGNELEGLLRIATTVPPEALLRYPATLNLGPRGALRHIQDVPTLLSGRVGDLVYDKLPRDAFGYVSLSDGDPLSQAADWEDELQRYPLMIVDRQPGGSHLEACAAEHATASWKERIGTVATILTHNEDWIIKQDDSRRNSSSHELALMAGNENPDAFLKPLDRISAA